MDEEPKPLTMQDLMEQNARLEKTVTGMAKIVEDILTAVDRETCQLWDYVLSRK
jgi:hypothetical protein